MLKNFIRLIIQIKTLIVKRPWHSCRACVCDTNGPGSSISHYILFGLIDAPMLVNASEKKLRLCYNTTLRKCNDIESWHGTYGLAHTGMCASSPGCRLSNEL